MDLLSSNTTSYCTICTNNPSVIRNSSTKEDVYDVNQRCIGTASHSTRNETLMQGILKRNAIVDIAIELGQEKEKEQEQGQEQHGPTYNDTTRECSKHRTTDPPAMTRTNIFRRRITKATFTFSIQQHDSQQYDKDNQNNCDYNNSKTMKKKDLLSSSSSSSSLLVYVAKQQSDHSYEIFQVVSHMQQNKPQDHSVLSVVTVAIVKRIRLDVPTRFFSPPPSSSSIVYGVYDTKTTIIKNSNSIEYYKDCNDYYSYKWINKSNTTRMIGAICYNIPTFSTVLWNNPTRQVQYAVLSTLRSSSLSLSSSSSGAIVPPSTTRSSSKNCWFEHNCIKSIHKFGCFKGLVCHNGDTSNNVASSNDFDYNCVVDLEVEEIEDDTNKNFHVTGTSWRNENQNKTRNNIPLSSMKETSRVSTLLQRQEVINEGEEEELSSTISTTPGACTGITADAGRMDDAVVVMNLYKNRVAYKKRHGRVGLNFHGRGRISSSKNVQLVSASTTTTTTHGATTAKTQHDWCHHHEKNDNTKISAATTATLTTNSTNSRIYDNKSIGGTYSDPYDNHSNDGTMVCQMAKWDANTFHVDYLPVKSLVRSDHNYNFTALHAFAFGIAQIDL